MLGENPHQTRHRKRQSVDAVPPAGKRARRDVSKHAKLASPDGPPTIQISVVSLDGRKTNVATLSDGTVVRPDDHIYLASDTPEEPYNIARVMELARSTPESLSFDGVRVNWFYRQRDVSHRDISDSRLVYATMHSDVVPLTSIRGLCSVQHRVEIVNHEDYRCRPDHFYYEKLFDKFIHRFYEVVPVAQVINVPEDVRAALVARFRYVVVELNQTKELSMQQRSCCKCLGWCSGRDSVRCSACARDFHMHCVDPPMQRKPSRGFAWSCTECVRAERGVVQPAEEPVDDEDGRPVSSPHPTVDVAKSCVEAGSDVRSKREHEPSSAGRQLWPLRYLGIYCSMEGVVDADDRIYPRAATRVGPRFQAQVAESLQPYTGKGKDLGRERGTERTATMVCSVGHLGEDELQARLDMRTKVAKDMHTTIEDPDVIDAVLNDRSDGVVGRPAWSADERASFAQAFRRFGANLHRVAQAVQSKSVADCVRYFYLWKVTEAGRLQIVRHRQHNVDEMRALTVPYRAPQLDVKKVQKLNKQLRCVLCSTDDAVAWSMAPDAQGPDAAVIEALCQRCASLWYRYAVQWEAPDILQRRIAEGQSRGVRRGKLIEHELVRDLHAQTETIKALDGQKGATATGGRRKSAGANTAAAVATTVKPDAMCVACRRTATDAVLTCSDCGASVHKACCGLADSPLLSWRCDVCTNVQEHSHSVDPRCILCPIKEHMAGLRPTSGNNWAHLQCAVWNLDLYFGDEQRMTTIEGVAALPRIYWQATCSFCETRGGACVACTICDTPLHVGCASAAGCQFAFEIVPIKTTQNRRDNLPTIRLGAEHGVLRPVVLCKQHEDHKLALHQPDENLLGSGENLLSTYVKTYRASDSERRLLSDGSVRLHPSGDLQRQDLLARLQQLSSHDPAGAVEVVNAESSKATTVEVPISRPSASHLQVMCTRCGIDVSPLWHKADDSWMCHLCRHEPLKRQVNLTLEEQAVVRSSIPIEVDNPSS